VDDVAAERHLEAVVAVQLERVLGHRLDGLGVDVAAGVLELDLGEGDPPVARDGGALGERIADREHLRGLLDLGHGALDRRAVGGVQHLALLDREDDVGGVAGLLREAALEQVVGALGFRSRQPEVVDVLTRGGAPQRGQHDEGGDP